MKIRWNCFVENIQFKVGTARCAVRAGLRRNSLEPSKALEKFVPPAKTRAETSQRDVPTNGFYKARWNFVTAFFLLLFAATIPSAKSAQRLSFDLSGEWEFKLDPWDIGRNERWFENTVSFDRTVMVPGSWNAQGVAFDSESQLRDYEQKRAEAQKELIKLRVLGEQRESARLFHVYPGPGWYRKTVTIPKNWKGKIPWLVFAGVHREVEVWINGKSAGSHLSYLIPFRIDLSSYAGAGETISIVARVDARHRKDVDPLMGTLDTADFVYATWGGIYKKVTLEAVETTLLDDIFVTPRLASETVEIRVAVKGERRDALAVGVEILDVRGNSVQSIKETVLSAKNEIVLSAKIPNPKLWSPKTPHLYTARVRLFSGDTVLDAHSIRFGMREFKVDGQNFLLNGKPIFLRGYGDDCIFPNTISPPLDKKEFRHRLLVAKEYGFNYVRHHSWVPPKEYLDAADELGMMIQPEFPFAYRWELPTTLEARRSALDQWETMIRLHRNHPSIVTWCRGNELYGHIDLAPEMHAIAKRLDPTRPFIDTDGCTFGDKDRASLDFLVVPFGEENSIGYQDGKYDFSAAIAKPVVAHEMGYFVTLHDLSRLKYFKNGLRPYWLFKTRDLVREKGWEHVYPDWLAASYRLQAVCLKSNMEAARRSRLKGTSVWLFQDYPNCAEGIVDMFFRPKAFQPEEFRKFNAPTVLLLDIPRRNWWNGETAEIKFVVSRFEDDPSDSAQLRWSLKSESRTIAEGIQEKLQIPSGGAQELPPIELKMPVGTKATRLTLAVELNDANGKVVNSWNLWSFPNRFSTNSSANVRFSKTNTFRSQYSGAQEYSSGTVPSDTELLVTTKLDPDILAFLKSGGRVLLLEPESVFPIEKTNFRLAAWDGGGPSGTIFDAKHAALRTMPSEGWCDLQFYSLIQGAKTVLLDSLPTKILPLVRCIDRSNRLMNRAYLFEASVGRGKLLVSGFNFSNSIASKDPPGIFLLDQLIRYASGPDFKPQANLAPEILALQKD